MKKEYLKSVKKNLSVPQKMKKEILQDLNEIFDSAEEHGETDEQVIQRLGDPKIYAEECSFKSADHKYISKKQKLISGLLVISALSCFVLMILVRLYQIPKGVIGQGTSLTNITITDNFPINTTLLFFILGLFFIFVLILFIVKSRHEQNKRKRSDTDE